MNTKKPHAKSLPSSFFGKSCLKRVSAWFAVLGAKLTLGQLGLSSGWLTQDRGAVTALNDGGGVGEDGAVEGQRVVQEKDESGEMRPGGRNCAGIEWEESVGHGMM